MLFGGHRFSFIPLVRLRASNSNQTIIPLDNPNKARKIMVSNILNPETSKSLVRLRASDICCCLYKGN